MALALLPLSRLAAPTEPGSRITEARQALDYWSGGAAELPGTCGHTLAVR